MEHRGTQGTQRARLPPGQPREQKIRFVPQNRGAALTPSGDGGVEPGKVQRGLRDARGTPGPVSAERALNANEKA